MNAFSLDERLRSMRVNKSCFSFLSTSRMINYCMYKAFCREDNCKKRHYALFHPVNDGNHNNSSSNDTTQNYETIGLNDKTLKLPQQSEATANTQLDAKHAFFRYYSHETIKWAYFHRK